MEGGKNDCCNDLTTGAVADDFALVSSVGLRTSSYRQCNFSSTRDHICEKKKNPAICLLGSGITVPREKRAMSFAVCLWIAMLVIPGPNLRIYCHRETTTDPAGLGKNNQWRMHVVRIRTVRCSETGRHARCATQHVEINARRDATRCKQAVSRLYREKPLLALGERIIYLYIVLHLLYLLFVYLFWFIRWKRVAIIGRTFCIYNIYLTINKNK